MATTTLQTARREFAAYLGYGDMVGKDGSAWTTTTDITASTSIISTELRDYGFDDFVDAGSGDDIFEGLWVIIHGSNNAQTVRRIKSYDASAGQITVTGTNLAAESGSTDFEIHRSSPTLLREILNTARVLACPALYLPVSRSTFTSVHQQRYDVPPVIIGKPFAIYLEKGIASTGHANNILSNPGFEDWTGSSPDSWSATTLDTAEETSTTNPYNFAVFREQSSVRATSQTGSTGTLLQSISSPGTHSGQRISFSIWVHCVTESKVRTHILINSTANTGTSSDGGEHKGTGWELLTHYEDAPITLSTLSIGVQVDSDATDNTEFYIDEAIAIVGPSRPAEEIGRQLYDWEYIPRVDGTELRNQVSFRYTLPENYLIRFEGKAYLSSVSSETDTFEIGSPETQLLYAYALQELYRRNIQRTPDIDEAFETRQLRRAEIDIERLTMYAPTYRRRQLTIPGWVR
tara:strand:- start:860 stop:2245 length:1386 start_codon:yes stop_codon:yes gene_type:complete